MHLQILLQFPREFSNETENCSANITQIRVIFSGYTIYKNKKEKKEIRMRGRFQKKALPGVAVRPGRVRFAPRPRRHGICRQADDTTAIGGRGGVIYFRGILSRGIIHKNMRFGEYDFVRYFFRKLLLFRYIWCIIRVERYPGGGIRRVIHCVRN